MRLQRAIFIVFGLTCQVVTNLYLHTIRALAYHNVRVIIHYNIKHHPYNAEKKKNMGTENKEKVEAQYGCARHWTYIGIALILKVMSMPSSYLKAADLDLTQHINC